MIRERILPAALAGVSIVALLGFSTWTSAQQTPPVPDRAEDAVPVKAGSDVPKANIQTMDGKEITLATALNKKPTVIIFYRGGWCPYCNVHLSELAKIETDIRKRGYQIIAITPDLPAELSKSVEKNQVNYKLYSDSKAEAMKAFGIAFRVDDKTFTMYRDRFKIDLERSSGQTHHYLPVPSVFAVNAQGVITFVHSEPDYKVRLKGQALLDALDRIAQ